MRAILHVARRELEELDEDDGARQALPGGQGLAGALLCVAPGAGGS